MTSPSADTRPLVEQIFGANWRTSVAGLSTTASAIVLALATLKPETWQDPKVWIPAVAVVIAKTIKDLNTKDACVSGNGSVFNPQKVAQSDGGNRTLPPVATLIVALLIPVFAFPIAGCSTNINASIAAQQQAIEKFNASPTGQRLTQDAQVAASAASAAAANETVSELQTGGKVDPKAIGMSAGAAAATSLLQLDVQRAQQKSNATP